MIFSIVFIGTKTVVFSLRSLVMPPMSDMILFSRMYEANVGAAFIAYVIGYPVASVTTPFPFALAVITGLPTTLFLYNDGCINPVLGKHGFGKMFIGATFTFNILVRVLLLISIPSDGG